MRALYPGLVEAAQKRNASRPEIRSYEENAPATDAPDKSIFSAAPGTALKRKRSVVNDSRVEEAPTAIGEAYTAAPFSRLDSKKWRRAVVINEDEALLSVQERLLLSLPPRSQLRSRSREGKSSRTTTTTLSLALLQSRFPSDGG